MGTPPPPLPSPRTVCVKRRRFLKTNLEACHESQNGLGRDQEGTQTQKPGGQQESSGSASSRLEVSRIFKGGVLDVDKRDLKIWRNLRGFPKPENTREGSSVAIQRKRWLETSIASKMGDRHTRSYNMFMCLPAENFFGQK